MHSRTCSLSTSYLDWPSESTILIESRAIAHPQIFATKPVIVGNRGRAVVALLPALPDGRKVALPDAIVQARPGVPAEDLVFIGELLVDAAGPIGGRIVGSDLQFPVVLRVE